VTLNVKAPLSSDEPHDQVLTDVLNELNQISFRDFQGALKRWHEGALSLIHLNVLMQLRFRGPVTMSHLAEMLDVSVASATGIVDRMEKKGVIERRRSDEDRRVVEVHVTQMGEDVFSAMQAERQARMTNMLSNVGADDLAALLTGLRAVRVARDEWFAAHGDEQRHGDEKPHGHDKAHSA
jgi:DNA-binding MarR family transcriptional regulator